MEMMANVWKERRGGRVRPSTVWTHVNPNDILTEKTRTEERWRLLVSLDQLTKLRINILFSFYKFAKLKLMKHDVCLFGGEVVCWFL